MTREEQIKEVADLYIKQHINPKSFFDVDDVFKAGAKWADEHPISPWISVNSSNPSDHKVLHRTFNGILIRDELRTVPVIARAVNGDKVIHIMAYMYLNRDTNLWEWVSLNKPIGKVYSITHWMLIPEL